jgi:hypothetical protein
MKAHSLLMVGAALAGLAGAAVAATPANTPSPDRSCFFSRDWQNWRAPDDNTIYLRVGVKEFYKIILSSGSPLLHGIDPKLVNRLRGGDSVCSPMDLDLVIHDGPQSEPIIAKSITKMTPDEVAAIPKKYLP